MRHQHGNVLFLILIAVILFAALSYAVTQSNKGGGSDARKEKSSLAGNQILNYANSVNAAVMALRISRGCDDTQISFENPIVSGYENANAPLDKRCHVFDPAGGGLAYQKPPVGSQTVQTGYVFTGGILYQDIGTTCFSDARCMDLSVAVMDIDKEVCAAINRGLFGEQAIPFHEIWAWNPNSSGYFTGTYRNDWAAAPTTSHPASSYITGKPTACYQFDNTPPRYLFFSVLIER
jgi:hypothetical protein